MKTNYPEVAIIMLNWNTPEMTISAIRSVLDSDYPNFMIHLTDNGSKDQSFEIIGKEFGDRIRLYRLENNRGYVGGMNYCLENGNKTDPHYFLIMNNDVILDPRAISELVETAEKYHDHCVVTGKVYFYDDPTMLQTVGNEMDRKSMNERRIGFKEADKGQYEVEAERKMIDDIFMLLPVKIYREVGGYSTYFFLNYEQTDLILRIIDKGYSVIYTPRAKLWHKGSFSTGGLGNPYMMYWEGKSSLVIHRLYQSNLDFLIYYVQYLRRLVWSLCKQLVKAIIGKKHKLKPALARMRGFLAGTAWLYHRKEENGFNPYQAKK